MSWLKNEKTKVIEKEMFEKAIEDEPMELEAEHKRLEREERLERMKEKKKRFSTRRMVRGVIEDIMEDVVGYADQEMAREIIGNILTVVDEEAKINNMIMELERGPPGMEEKLEARLRKRR